MRSSQIYVITEIPPIPPNFSSLDTFCFFFFFLEISYNFTLS